MLFSQFLILNHNNYVISCWVLTEVDKENGRREPCYDSIDLLYRLVHIDKKEGKKKLFIAIRRYHLKFSLVFSRDYTAYILILKNACHIEGSICVQRRHIFTDFNNDGI